MSFADSSTHFVNLPLKHFTDLYTAIVGLQRELVFKTGCKLQSAPHVSMLMLDLSDSNPKKAWFTLNDCIDYMYEGDLTIRITNVHLLGTHIVCDVDGLQDWHDELLKFFQNAGFIAGQSRVWHPHVTLGTLVDENVMLDSFDFDYTLDIKECDPFYLEVVKIGALKADGVYNFEFGTWVYDRFDHETPTYKFGQVMGFCCFEDVFNEILEGFPSDMMDAYEKLEASYNNNGWFWDYVRCNSKTFRKHCAIGSCVPRCCEVSDEEDDVFE